MSIVRFLIRFLTNLEFVESVKFERKVTDRMSLIFKRLKEQKGNIPQFNKTYK